MPRGARLERDFVTALRLLDAPGVPYAEIWRGLAPVAERLGRPRPSYHCVRSFLIEERRRRIARAALADAVVDELLRGMAPWSLMKALC